MRRSQRIAFNISGWIELSTVTMGLNRNKGATMMREEVLKKITSMLGIFLEDLVAEIGDDLESAGLQPRIGCHITLFTLFAAPVNPDAALVNVDDAEFLRKLHIVPDLEAK